MVGVIVSFRNGEEILIKNATNYQTVCDGSLVAVVVGDKQVLVNMQEIRYVGYAELLE